MELKVKAATTDLSRWRLTVAKGRQTWKYIEEDETEEEQRDINFIERHFLGLDKVFKKIKLALLGAYAHNYVGRFGPAP